ncbi:hypothetical protein AB0C69_15875 [Actinomadura sp. NPDC048032]|uniref:hypothetical protein n=1 Tax=Actinomadura sp. NPDC048032 TaxID=3155747 RepID=UPI003401ADC4
MSTPSGLPAAGWPIADDAPFVTGGHIPDGIDADTLSRFGARQWNLSRLDSHAHAHAVTITWDQFEDPAMCLSIRRASWCLVNLPTPEQLLERKGTNRVAWPSARTIYNHFANLREFANWLTSNGIGTLAEVTVEDLDRYAVRLSTQGTAKTTYALYAITLLWGYSPHLPPQDRIPMPPWEAGDLDDYLPGRSDSNENSTPPIHPAVMSPLLIWALRFVEDFSGDIIAAWQERQRLVSRTCEEWSEGARLRIEGFVQESITSNRPLPGAHYHGRHGVADTYLAGMLEVSPRQVHRVLEGCRDQITISDHAPLNTPIHGQLHERAWIPAIDFHEAPRLMRHLSAASLIVIAYLSGMRIAEVLALQVGCCPEPVPDDGGGTAVRYEIYGNVLKGVREEQGRRIPDGKPRDLPWTVIPPVVRAIRVLELITEGDALFPLKTTWTNISDLNERPRRKRTGLLLSAIAARQRVHRFIEYANRLANEHGLAHEHIPDDPDGRVTPKRFRRTIAWHIARLPGGRIALAIQYGHLRASTVSEGYSGRARHGVRRVLDLETARAMADYLDNLAERIRSGEGISGPAARRMFKATKDAAVRFEGLYLTPKQADALLDEPQFHIYDNPEAFLTCNYDPTRALCHPHQAGRGQRNRPPAINRCDPACANIARTDIHIAGLRTEIRQLQEEITDPLTPTPLRERLKQRSQMLEKIASRHEHTRITKQSPQQQDHQ